MRACRSFASTRSQPAAYAEFPAAVADEHVPLDDDRRHRDALANVDVAELRFPDLLSRGCVDRSTIAVERVDENFSVVENGAAIHDVAARHALRGKCRLRIVFPFVAPLFFRSSA